MATQQLEGFDVLARQLSELEKAVGGKALRSAAMSATLPAFKQIKSNAPVGTVPHKTYKGRLVQPGFGKASIKRRSRLSRNKTRAVVSIGIDQEAFYMVNFVELGVPSNNIPPRPWMEPVFRAYQIRTTDRLGDLLRTRIERAAALNR